jgi:transposase
MGKPAVSIAPNASERRELEPPARAHKTGQAMARRARIVPAAAAGLENKAVSAEVGADANTVSKRRRRFAEHRLDGLLDGPRPGTPRKIGDDETAGTVRLTLEATPPGATHWSLRSMAEAVGHAPSAIHRIWRAFGLQPHRSEAFKLSNDPPLVEKVRDIVGLYLSPPDRALVLCADEKSQIQALDRTQPLLPMRPGQAERRTHDHTRHGTASLFAALDVAAGAVIGRCYPKHRSGGFRKFLDQIEAGVPADPDVHLAMDNYATRKTKPIRDWLAKRPRWHVHFTPTGASWIDQVERSFAPLTDKQIRRGVHRSTQQLDHDIRAFIDAHNADPKPFRWTKSADGILAAIQRVCQPTQQAGSITESGH